MSDMGGARLAFQSMDTGGPGNPFREGGRAPAGPILTDSGGNNVSLQNPGARPCHADGLQLCRCRDRIVRRQYHQRELE